ncbi:hypothetical protein H206_00904 [Candidatus Electrothrix aarhusensis]|uniref:Uncharacterized protein n=1 Tax=Candidatus Electrothrix aarhusensis TaxID=1859131 RepID=A0A3S3SLK2_9BACT|nr:hypothetical protein H206_00904 [Candidatus Electrothrix aarhusensis]
MSIFFSKHVLWCHQYFPLNTEEIPEVGHKETGSRVTHPVKKKCQMHINYIHHIKRKDLTIRSATVF